MHEKLLAIFACIRRAGHAPLGSGIDASGILRSVSVSEDVAAIFDAEIRQALGAPRRECTLSTTEWLDGFFAAARAVDARALEIVELRLRGFDERDIAERLETGLRLVRRIIEDLRC